MNVTVKTAKSILSTLVYQQLEEKNPPPVCLWGPPGIGKSDITRQAAAENDISVVDVRLSQMDPVDLRGVPWINGDGTKWATPAFFPRDPTGALILLDELPSAMPEVQVAAYQLLLERQCGEYKLPPKVYICAAGNRAEDHAISNPMPSALANRMLHIEIDPDDESWCEWAVTNEIAPEVVGFIHMSPDSLFRLTEECERGWPSPRSWANVSKVLSYGFADDALLASVVGLVGEYAAAQFMAFRKHYQELGDIHEIMLDPKSKWKPSSRNDMLYAVATAIAHWVWRGKSLDESAKLLNGFFRIAIQLPAPFAMVALSDAISGKDGEIHAQQLQTHKLFSKLQDKVAIDKATGE